MLVRILRPVAIQRSSHKLPRRADRREASDASVIGEVVLMGVSSATMCTILQRLQYRRCEIRRRRKVKFYMHTGTVNWSSTSKSRMHWRSC